MINYGFYNSNPTWQNHGTMKINGVGMLKVEPNMAIIRLGVITENISLEEAQRENTLKSTSVINQLYQMGIPKNQIQTASYNIEPQYDFVEGKQVFRGYKVTNILSVTMKDLSRIGEVIDSATSSGANSVSNIVFDLEDPSIYYNQALNLAIRNAVIKALEVGNKLGVNVNEIPCKIIEESYSKAVPQASMLQLTAATTPILPGEISINAKIEAIFNY
ncbi:SIMPL domain-containing protein [Clostridium sp. MSJ-4]|uniref:SIMPL domain-containing protein n=1 Tax=Clostridium simiarum TaxID=2841506 RepID=A0ABS6F3Y1_9CLOT|nr:SIMPL domain-containing protein [Clostridium simiarum]MBU5592252.1 SIMPL domain-containing protein [Clostridium simiarum]